MIRALVGNLFDSDAQTLVNTVNCVGVMGKGVALEFKKRFPDMYDDYVERCSRGQVRLGEPYLYARLFPPSVLNFPTKDHWRSVSKLSDIVAGLIFLEQHYQEWGITSLAVPPLGCGQGQLEWRVVGPTLWRHLARLGIPVELYAPEGTPQAELESTFLGNSATPDAPTSDNQAPSRISAAWVALVEILARIEREQYHWPIGRTRFQKLAYFATALGLPTELHFQRGSYGPFAPEVKPLVTRLVNNGLLREDTYGNMLLLRSGPTYQDAVQAHAYQNAIRGWDAQIDKVADLLLRVPTSDTEIVATVHYVWQYLSHNGERKVSEAEVLGEVRRWKQRRKPPLNDDAIVQTIRDMHMLAWIHVDFDAASAPSEDELMALT